MGSRVEIWTRRGLSKEIRLSLVCLKAQKLPNLHRDSSEGFHQYVKTCIDQLNGIDKVFGNMILV
jgi:hypothetical protein